jgi:hypothetical protein
VLTTIITFPPMQTILSVGGPGSGSSWLPEAFRKITTYVPDRKSPAFATLDAPMVSSDLVADYTSSVWEEVFECKYHELPIYNSKILYFWVSELLRAEVCFR